MAGEVSVAGAAWRGGGRSAEGESVLRMSETRSPLKRWRYQHRRQHTRKPREKEVSTDLCYEVHTVGTEGVAVRTPWNDQREVAPAFFTNNSSAGHRG